MASRAEAAPAADSWLRLDNQLCFRLYAASRLVTRLYRPLLDELGLTYPQYLVLLALWQWDADGDAGPRTVTRIAGRLMLDAGTLTPLLKRMETAGLVARRRGSEGDGREVHVELTAAGRRLKQRAVRVPQSLAAMPGLPLADLPLLAAALDRLIAAGAAAEAAQS